MYIKPHWRILTIGDGDLSFSASLWKKFQPKQLTATVLDSQQVLENKYQQHAIELLKSNPYQQVLFSFDVTKPESWHSEKAKLIQRQFDLVIFQFPLVPAFDDPEFFHQLKDISVNTINRLLLRQYLIHCAKYFLDPDGEQLCYITSKDVKPYSEWNIENCLNRNLENIHYLGAMPFEIEKFPGYKVRNVDRDKHVKDTQGITYIWSLEQLKNKSFKEWGVRLTPASHQGQEFCTLCKAGPFISKSDELLHLKTKKHRLMQQYEDQYNRAISKI